MNRAIKAGVTYALIVFLFGFALGAFRIFLVIPRIGETAAVSLEAPLILTASWFACRWCIDRLNVRRMLLVRSLMGIVAFAMLMTLEIGVSVIVFGRSVSEYAASYGSTAGEVGVLAQIAFAVLPVIQVWRR